MTEGGRESGKNEKQPLRRSHRGQGVFSGYGIHDTEPERNDVSFSTETVEKVERAARELGYELPHRKNKNSTKKEKTDRCDLSDADKPILRPSFTGYRIRSKRKRLRCFYLQHAERDAGQEEKYLRMIRYDRSAGNYLCMQSASGFSEKSRGSGAQDTTCYHQQ